MRHANVFVLRQMHKQAPRNADLRRQTCALGADGVLDDLHHNGLTFKHLVLNRLERLVLARDHGRVAAFMALPHIGHMQEGGTLQANVDKGRLHARQHTRDFAQIDIAHQATLQRAFDVQLLHSALLYHSHTRFLR